MLIVAVLSSGQVELEADGRSRLPRQINELPGHEMVSRRHPATVALERNGWPLACVCTAVGEHRWQGHQPEIHVPRCPHCERRRCNRLSTGHAGDGGDVELQIIHERQQVWSVGWLDSVHLNAASFDGLIQKPVIADNKLADSNYCQKQAEQLINSSKKVSGGGSTHTVNNPVKRIKLATEHVPPSSVFLFLSTC